MTQTQGQLLESVRDRLNEATEGMFKNEMLRRWINEGAQDIARRTETLQTRADVDVTNGTREYALPDDVIRVHRVEWNADNETQSYALEYRDWQNMDAIWYTQQAVTTARPVYYTTWGFPPSLQIVVYPIPYANGNLKVFYYRLPAVLTSNGSDVNAAVEVPEGWADCIVDYCEYMALRRDRDGRWQEAKQLYEEHIGELFDVTRRWVDQGGVVVPDTPMVPMWLYGDGYGW